MLIPPKLFIDKVDDLIKGNLNHPDLLQVLKRNLHLSSSQVYRKIKKKSGFAPSTYIRKKRLEIAKEWVGQTDAPITEIAYRTGFQNLPYFSRCFSVEFGLTPSQFRKQNF